MRVLVVDDEPDVQSVVERALSRDGHVVFIAGTIAESRAAMDRGVDLVVLDLRLPDGSGLDLCRELRAAGDGVPVLVVTAHDHIAQRVEGLDRGADDVMGKPFAIAELRARVRALARRGRLPPGLVARVGDAKLDIGARRAQRAGKDVAVTGREWAILELLASRGGRVVSRSEILESVWGVEAGESLDVLVGRLRKKLGAGVVRTLRGVGYAIGGEIHRE